MCVCVGLEQVEISILVISDNHYGIFNNLAA